MNDTADENKSASSAAEPPLVASSCGDVANTTSTETDGSKTATTPSAADGASCSNAITATTTKPKLPETLTVVRFLISNLQGGLKHAPSDYHVDLILELHGLYDLVSTVYSIARSAKCTTDSVNSHLWDVTFNGKRYRNGWRHCRHDTKDWNRPADETDVDLGERRLLSGLSVKTGQEGRKSGESLVFDLKVIDLSETVKSGDVLVKIPSSSVFSGKEFDVCGGGKKGDDGFCAYPKVAKVILSISGHLSEDWIDRDAKAQSLRLRGAWSRYNEGLNGWKRDRREGGWIPSKPISPAWGKDEREIIGLLLNSGCKFKQSWNNILQHVFVDRTESSTSMKWYQLAKKDYFMIERTGRGMTNEARIQLAKRLAKSLLARHIKKGRAAKDPHPDAEIEGNLRKRGLITDDTDEYEKKRLCATYRCCF